MPPLSARWKMYWRSTNYLMMLSDPSSVWMRCPSSFWQTNESPLKPSWNTCQTRFRIPTQWGCRSVHVIRASGGQALCRSHRKTEKGGVGNCDEAGVGCPVSASREDHCGPGQSQYTYAFGFL